MTKLASRILLIILVFAMLSAGIGSTVDSNSPEKRDPLTQSSNSIEATDIDSSTTKYDLSVPDAIDTPEKTVTIEGTEYTIDAVGVVSSGETLSVDVTSPSGTDFDVDLYNSDKQVEAFEGGSGSERISFDTDNLDPGSYFLALYVDGNHVKIHPIVVRGYDVQLTDPGTITTDAEDATATVDVTSTDIDSPPNGVEVAIWNGETTIRKDAVEVGDMTYEATFDVDKLTEGTYGAYAAVQGSMTVDGEPELLGVSDRRTLEITGSENEGTGSDNDEDSGPDDDDDENSVPDNDNETEENITNSSDSDNSTDENVTPEDEIDNTTDQDNGTETNDSDKETNDSVLSPTPETNETEDDSDDAESIPLRAPQLLAFALLLSGLVLRMRRRIH